MYSIQCILMVPVSLQKKTQTIAVWIWIFCDWLDAKSKFGIWLKFWFERFAYMWSWTMVAIDNHYVTWPCMDYVNGLSIHNRWIFMIFQLNSSGKKADINVGQLCYLVHKNSQKTQISVPFVWIWVIRICRNIYCFKVRCYIANTLDQPPFVLARDSLSGEA